MSSCIITVRPLTMALGRSVASFGSKFCTNLNFPVPEHINQGEQRRRGVLRLRSGFRNPKRLLFSNSYRWPYFSQSILDCFRYNNSIMGIRNRLGFLKPGFLNLLLTVFVLFLPILREQYYTGEYVTYHRPINVIINYFQNFQQPHLLLIMVIFLFVIYFVVSFVIFGISKFILPLFKTHSLR